ncbi:Carboxylesterase [Sedimentisphaera cyanobacteriorum]|uniref:Carboxylesterase n=1 Tax=Sedimentisphaera cyanobacteriorum TaxID=1940790 RepID=A0A1Q2HRD8_9BACT|nr:carboxylesterase family protein [Sedimentisphaera cyanobacteriorum]AQQ09834.1 Carboxylesterase [Sedimentisphaera cyanobacteriorum]
MKSVLALVCFAAMLQPGPVYAQAAGDRLDRAFKRLDSDRNGSLSHEEAPRFAPVAERLAGADADANGDGTITPDEARSWRREERRQNRPAPAAMNGALPETESEVTRQERLFQRLDADNDGKFTQAEAGGPDWFDRLDRNGDGVIEQNELPGNNAGPRNRRTETERNAPAMPQEPPHTAHLDLRYDEIEGVDPNLLSLDLYVPEGKTTQTGRPVLVMIHGGGWRGGDKANRAIVGGKMHHFVSNGYIYASINYRLSPQGPNDAGVQHPVHAQDCAKAIAWIHDHIDDYGGDPAGIHLMGHSAGAHLAGLIGTNDRFLKAEGKSLAILKSNVLLDTAALDIAGYLEAQDGKGMTALYHNAFTDKPANWRDASPRLHVKPDKQIPPTLIFYGGTRMLLNRFAPDFARALREACTPAQAIDVAPLDHGQINAFIGTVDDPMTALIMRLHAGDDASRFPARITAYAAEPPDREGAGSQNSVTFEHSYLAGTRDPEGHFLGGTETMHLVAHEGKLFAGLGYWTDQPGSDPRPGAQILRKDGPDQLWRLEHNFSGALRINAMDSVTFSVDHRGEKLGSPVTLLVADAGLIRSRGSGALVCFVRNDGSGGWDESRIVTNANRAYIRAFGFHRDAKTGVEYLFAGTGAGEVYRGSYDATVPGRIRWESTPEYANPDFDDSPFKRCQGFAVANGRLYASVSPRLLVRRDGPEPRWTAVFRWKPEQRPGAGLRGITAVAAPDGTHEVILGSREQEVRILRIDPEDGHKVTDELNSQQFLKEQLGNFRGGRLVAYNRLVPGRHPVTGQPIHWVTVAGIKPNDTRAAWLLIRHADATYDTVRVFDPNLDPHPLLVSTRTLEFAPWNTREFYTGGYDGAANDRKNHNTAWIFKGIMK